MKTGIFIGLIIGNFSFQLFASQDWGRAVAFSFMQGIALLCVHINEKLFTKKS